MSSPSVNEVAGVVFAAGKGSRMIGYGGNKTLLPLAPGRSLYEGERPLILEVLENLPSGPKGIVVSHCAEEVEKATAGLGARYLLQPETNGTGGALLAARPFLNSVSSPQVLVTMGDVPLIRSDTYRKLMEELAKHDLAVLAFAPKDKAQYGMIEMEGNRAVRIVEWKYWKDYPAERRSKLLYCNAGVYAAKRPELLKYLDRLAGTPHRVRKQRGDRWVEIEEYFLTDLVEMMSGDGLSIGIVIASEEEVMGVDTPEGLAEAQRLYAKRRS